MKLVCFLFYCHRSARPLWTSFNQKWRAVSQKFGDRWNFYHACGAIDGKHSCWTAPKVWHDVFQLQGLLLHCVTHLVGADYKLLWASVGSPGSNSDAGVFNSSSLEPDLREHRLKLPDAVPLPNDDHNYFMIGDNAFPLRTWMQTLFSQQNLNHDEQIFNYRLSRACRVVENAFGILPVAGDASCRLSVGCPDTSSRLVWGCITSCGWYTHNSKTWTWTWKTSKATLCRVVIGCGETRRDLGHRDGSTSTVPDTSSLASLSWSDLRLCDCNSNDKLVSYCK